MSTTKPPSFAEALGSDIVEFLVGQEAKVFRVHKQVICKVEVFERMLNGSFQEAQLSKVHLPEDDPLAFAAFLEWIYGQDMELLDVRKIIMQCVKVYCVAAKYMVTKLTDELMVTIYCSVREDESLLDESVIDYVYKTAPQSVV